MTLVDDIVYTQAIVNNLAVYSVELQHYLSAKAVEGGMRYAVLFQRSHWVKGYYVPAVVAAANAQHPVFRVQERKFRGGPLMLWDLVAHLSICFVQQEYCIRSCSHLCMCVCVKAMVK